MKAKKLTRAEKLHRRRVQRKTGPAALRRKEARLGLQRKHADTCERLTHPNSLHPCTCGVSTPYVDARAYALALEDRAEGGE